MTPEMEKALQRQYPRRKVRTVDVSFLGRDPALRELIIIHTTPDNLFCYHVPKWEVLSWILAMLRHLGPLDCIRAVWFNLFRHGRGRSVTIKRVTIGFILLAFASLVWALAIAELVHFFGKHSP